MDVMQLDVTLLEINLIELFETDKTDSSQKIEVVHLKITHQT